MIGDIYVTKNDDRKYVVRVEGQFDTQEEAIQLARSISRRLDTEFTIRDATGQIRSKDSHGNDPPEVKG